MLKEDFLSDANPSEAITFVLKLCGHNVLDLCL